MRLQEPDLSWLLRRTATTAAPRREFAVRASLVIWHRVDRPAVLLDQIKAFARNDPALLAMVAEAEQPHEEADYMMRLRAIGDRRARREKLARARDEKGWREFAKSLESNTSALTDPAQRDSEQQFRRLWWLRTWMEARQGGDRNVYSIANWQDLREGFGDPIAQAARTGFKAYWRRQSPKLPSELRPEEQNTVHYSTILGLTGLAVEATGGPDWVDTLSELEVESAVRLALRELNGLPAWFAALTRRHRTSVYRLLIEEARRELTNTETAIRPDVLERLRYERGADFPGLAEQLVSILRPLRKFSGPALGHAIDILIAAEDVKPELLARLARSKLKLKLIPEEARLRFLALLFAADAAQGATCLDGWIVSAPHADRQGRAERAFATLVGEGERVRFAFPQDTRVPTLTRLVRLAYQFVHPSDDQRHIGVYSPSARDRAEHARAWLLRELATTPGAATFDALKRLADWSGIGLSREWVIHLARERAEFDAGGPWRSRDVADFELHRARHPTSGQELLQLTVRRLDEISDHLDGSDFSQRALLRQANPAERDLQLWIADRLSLVARGYYTVSREEEVIARKKPDIRVHSSEANTKVSIEVKVADYWSGALLQKAVTAQLIGQYQRDPTCRHGILVLIGRGERQSWQIGGRRVRSLEALAVALRRSAEKPRKIDGVYLTAAVVTLSV